MTSKQRVRAAFFREKADRVPIDYSGNQAINDKLMRHFKSKDYFDMLDALNVDFRQIYAEYVGKDLFPKLEGRRVDSTYGYYMRWIEHSSGGYWDFCDYPLMNADSQKIAEFPVPNPDDFDYLKVAEQIKRFKDRAVYIGSAGHADIINSTGRVMGMEDTLVNLQTEDEATLHYISRRCDMEIGKLERLLDKYKDSIDFVWIGEDLGTQIAPMISMRTYKKVIQPFHKRYIDLAKSFNLPVMVHTCGSSSWVYEEFIQMGVDAVDTLQPEARDMSPRYLVEKFKGRLSFHGCISTAGALAYGNKEDVKNDVISTLEIMMPTKGYMLSPTHSVQDNSPLENVLEMYECAVKYGKY